MTLLPLAARTTLRVGGMPAAEVVIESLADVEAVFDDLRLSAQKWTVLGGGSNVVAADGPLDLTVILMRARHVDAVTDGDAVIATVDAGASWDELVELAVREGWSGIEALSGIPGSVGATPIQNVGAYGSQVSDVISQVEVFDPVSGMRRWLMADECDFGYRSSIFKRNPLAAIVTRVRFVLQQGTVSAPVRYAQLAEALGISIGESAPTASVRQAVLALRRSKGMVLDPGDHDTWSAGSYFTNPRIDADAAARIPEAPQWAEPDGRVKVSAAWLIEAAGFPRGFVLADSNIAISSKHALALTNRGGGSAAQVRALETAITAGVRAAFGVELEREPVLLGF